jgi:hypothetical protein
MYISLANSRAHGFRKWCDAHHPGNDEDEPSGATPITITEPPRDEREAIEEPPKPPDQPWQVPGVGSSF